VETLVIQTEGPSETETVKAILEALDLKVDVFPNQPILQEEVPSYVSKLMVKSLGEADNDKFTSNEDFMTEVKAKYKR